MEKLTRCLYCDSVNSNKDTNFCSSYCFEKWYKLQELCYLIEAKGKPLEDVKIANTSGYKIASPIHNVKGGTGT